MKQRCISAFVLAFLCIPLFLIGGLSFTFFILFLAFLSLKELEDCIETKKELPFFMKFLTFLSVGFLFLFAHYSQYFQFLSYPILAILFFLYFIPTIFYKNNTYTVLEAFLLVGIVLFLSFVFSFLLYLRKENISYFIYLLLISIFTDTYALLVGSLVGKHKLIPRISPNKTWEGAIGGSIFATFIASFYFRTFVNYDFPLVLLGIMTLFLSIIGQLGDLFFSAIKRYFKKKDFSQLIPGHGGILDRIDNFLFVALAFMALLAFL